MAPVDDDDEISTTKDRRRSTLVVAASSSDSRLPLSAWPLRGGQSGEVPEIFGLDKYDYGVGKRVATRAEHRFGLSLRDEQRAAQAAAQSLQVGGTGKLRPTAKMSVSAPSSRPSSAVRPKNASRPKIIEPGTSGCSAVMWNSGLPTQDSSLVQLRKRRQKLTEDVLKEIKVSHGDPLKSVRWWFSVFEFYCDPPEDTPLPMLPERRDDETPVMNAAAEPSSVLGPPTSPALLPREKRDSPVHELERASSAPRLAYSMQAEECDARHGVAACRRDHKVRTQRRAQSASGVCRAVGPMARQSLRRSGAGPLRVQGPLFSDALWDRRRRELRRDRVALDRFSPKDVGGSSLAERCRTECLDREKYQSFLKDCSQRDSNFDKLQAAVGAPAEEQGFSGFAKLLAWKTPAVKKPEQSACGDSSSASDGEGLMTDDDASATGSASGSGSASATVGTIRGADSSVRKAKTDAGGRKKVAGETVMLRSLSLSLVTSKLLRNHSSQQENAQPSYEEVARERAMLLAAVAPVELNISGLFKFCSCLGVTRNQIAERIYTHVRHSANVGNGLSFRMFYHLLREFRAEVDPAQWKKSEDIRRLLFSVIVDGNEAKHAHSMETQSVLSDGFHAAVENAAVMRWRQDKEQRPCNYASVQESLRLFLCNSVLLKFDQGSRLGGEAAAKAAANSAAASLNPASAAAAKSGLELGMLVSFLHTELMRCEAAGGDVERSVNGVSYEGFERFVAHWPDVFELLVWLLLPLASRGFDYVEEEMSLMAKQLTHRAGELRAQMHVEVQKQQRKHFERLHSRFIAPWHEARNASRSVRNSMCSGALKVANLLVESSA